MPKAEIEKRQRSLYIMAQCHCINFKKTAVSVFASEAAVFE
jgi:hypothetical protein